MVGDNLQVCRHETNFRATKDYRRGWATYEATYLFAKLIALLIVAVVDPNNCLFRTLPQQGVQVARQIILLATMVGFFLLQCFRAPFLDPVSNASEWTSRMNYVLTALIALLVALNVPGKSALSGVVTYMYVRIQRMKIVITDHSFPECTA